MIKSVEKVRYYLSASLLVLLAGAFPAAHADNPLERVRISSLLDFNAILITEVDVVLVYDQATADSLPSTKGEWYAQKYDLLKDDTVELDLITTSIPQGFDSTTLLLPDHSASAVKIFAVGYHEAQGTAIHDMTNMTNALIQIDQFGIRVSEPR